ncbi:MAG: bifunctional riboflavin kinase/FMN adenylyltransferase, partial [Mogibacterium sp.]|nr:bifunctional riboflavin kinase/FMN adenylyltransferase [Mogibacterium sp.]
MQIINDLNQLNINEKTAVALGNFDGIHIGHQKIMQKAIDAAKEQGLKSLCFTFSN